MEKIIWMKKLSSLHDLFFNCNSSLPSCSRSKKKKDLCFLESISFLFLERLKLCNLPRSDFLEFEMCILYSDFIINENIEFNKERKQAIEIINSLGFFVPLKI